MKLMWIVAVVALGACSKKIENKKESLSYEFTVPGCTTGKHTFNSVSALCTGLANDARNNNCAHGDRYRLAQQYKCSHVAPRPAAAVDSLSYAYHFVTQTCDTGRHEVATQAELCQSLQDEARNQGCAFEQRRKLFLDTECNGQ